ncbi:MAG: hypothetical protein H3C34_25330 [Caldilineaceae bacterium]|nr:hypothetical protein [Caldilineaceae bacterium]
MPDKVPLDMVEISRRLKAVALPEVDLVVGVATGGIVPASLAAYRLERPLAVMAINFRAPNNSPQHQAPVLQSHFVRPAAGTRVLLVDDVSVSGQTLELAKRQLEGCQVTTLVLKGTGDLVLFPEVGACVFWPWKLE